MDCIKFLLAEGADFVMTHRFNQDPLEQHFGHHRHRGGNNNNPTVYDVQHNMTQLRTISTHALAPKRGNTKRVKENIPIDHSKLPKIKRLR